MYDWAAAGLARSALGPRDRGMALRESQSAAHRMMVCRKPAPFVPLRASRCCEAFRGGDRNGDVENLLRGISIPGGGLPD